MKRACMVDDLQDLFVERSHSTIAHLQWKPGAGLLDLEVSV